MVILQHWAAEPDDTIAEIVNDQTMTDLLKEMETGSAIAREAGEIALRYFRKGIAYEEKSDDSPVTRADRECEQFIAQELDAAFPEDGLLGEEGTQKASRSGRRWIIDPIDGTRDFVRGNPTWSNLIGLEADGQVVAGFVNMPALGELFTAARGGGAYLNDGRIRASSIGTIAQAVLCFDALNCAGRQPFGGELLAWMDSFWAVRSMGGCMDAMMVARGQAEIWIETSGKPWDFAALKIVAEEAGARFFSYAGEPTIYGGNCVICAPAMEDAVRRFLAGGATGPQPAAAS